MVVAAGTLRPSVWSFAELSPTQTQYLTHGYHRYPAKFIPQLVRQLLCEYSKVHDCVCDPFGGCGTTLVEAKLTNRMSFGFDINPVAVVITRTKITAICPDILSERFSRLRYELENAPQFPSIGEDPRLNISRLLYWFGEENLKRLMWIKNRVEQEESPNIRRFFLCSLSHVLKNCSYWLATSTKPQKDPKKKPENPFKAFSSHASRMIERNSAFFNDIHKLQPGEPTSIMRKADARNLPLPNRSIDLVVTSPPYSTSYEYPDIHQLPALLFGFCTSIKDFRRGFIGSKNGDLYSYRDKQLKNTKACEAVRALRLVDAGLASAIQAYFLDMKYVYRQMYRILKMGGRACIVIGDTELRGISIPSAEVAVEQMCEIGFLLEQAIDRPIPRRILSPYRDKDSGRFTSTDNPAAKKIYNHEYILVLKKK